MDCRITETDLRRFPERRDLQEVSDRKPGRLPQASRRRRVRPRRWGVGPAALRASVRSRWMVARSLQRRRLLHTRAPRARGSHPA